MNVTKEQLLAKVRQETVAHAHTWVVHRRHHRGELAAWEHARDLVEKNGRRVTVKGPAHSPAATMADAVS